MTEPKKTEEPKKSGWYPGKAFDKIKENREKKKQGTDWYVGKFVDDIAASRREKREQERLEKAPIDNSVTGSPKKQPPAENNPTSSETLPESSQPSDDLTTTSTVTSSTIPEETSSLSSSTSSPSSTTTSSFASSSSLTPPSPSTSSTSTNSVSSTSPSPVPSSTPVALRSSSRPEEGGSLKVETSPTPKIVEAKRPSFMQSARDRVQEVRNETKARVKRVREDVKELFDAIMADDGKDEDFAIIGQSQAPQPSGPVIGSLSYKILQANNLAPRKRAAGGLNQRNPSVRVIIEGKQQKTNTVNQSQNPVWDEEQKDILIHDITGDIVFQVLDERRVRKDVMIGQAILPLSVLLNYQLKGQRTDELWLELFPKPLPDIAETTLNKLHTTSPNIRGSGMAKPKAVLGFLKVSLNLKLILSPDHAYLNSEPYHYQPKQAAFSPILLRQNLFRIKNALSAPEWLLYINDVVSWNYVPSSIGGLALALYLVLYGHFSLFLWLCTFIFVRAGFIARDKKRKTRNNYILWDQDGGDDLQADKTAYTKLLEVKTLIFKLQKFLGVLASQMERTSNAFNWTDELASKAAVGAVVVVLLSLSVILFILPIRFLLSVLVVAAFARVPLSKRAKKSDTRVMPKWLKDLVDNGRNLYSHIPDDLEYKHRLLAERSVQFSATPPTQSQLGLPLK